MLGQFQKEFWTRFSIPLLRLDSAAIRRMRNQIPAHYNVFDQFDRSIVSIDTLKQDSQIRAAIEQSSWDLIIIDEAHNAARRVSSSGGQSLRSRLAKLLSRKADSLMLLTASPHDGSHESFASLTERRFRSSPEVDAAIGKSVPKRKLDRRRFRLSAPEEAAYEAAIFSEYRARIINAGFAEPDDAYRETVEILGSEAPSLPYRAVVVDEAQDMGEQAFRLIRAIVPQRPDGDRNSLFIVGDAHQRIYGRRASMTACGINVRGRSRRLRLNYRTSDEIRKWAVSILEGVAVDGLDEGLETLSGYTSVFKGPAPDLAEYGSEEEEIAALLSWLRDLQESGTKLADVAILASTRLQLDRLAPKLTGAGLEIVRLQPSQADDRTLPGVRLATMHRAKGLEFQGVGLPFLSKFAFPAAGALRAAIDEVDRRNIVQQQRSLLHVAATRAKRFLRVSWSGEPSIFLVMTPSAVS
jgi:superfamily I DNA/RNA helicase